MAFEIKYSVSPKLTKGFWNALEDLAPRVTYVVYPGNESYPIAQNVFTLPVSQIHEIIDQKA